MTSENIFSIDGETYDVSVTSLKINGEKIASDDTGRLKNLEMYIKYDGIFVNYEMTISKRLSNNKEFFKLFDKLLFDKSKPKHKVVFPYGNKKITFNAYCPAPSIDIKQFLGYNKYDKYGVITIKFIAISPTGASPL